MTCTWKVTDSDANTSESDSDSLKFTVVVKEPDTPPVLKGGFGARAWWVDEAITPVELPKATGGNGLLSYSLSGCQLPGGVTLAGRRLSGKPGAVSSEVTCTWKVTDSDDNASTSDSDSLAFSIEVLEPALVVAPSSLGVDEGKSDTFTVKLAARPTGTVTVTVTSGDAGAATASPASLTFTAADYGTARPVTVTGAGDDDTEDEETTVALSASGGGYGSVSASVDVTVKDDDEPALVLSREELALAEGDFGEFTVKLATRPTATVTVSVTSGEPEAAAASPSSLTFTAENYGAARKVTVLGEQDDDAEHEETTVALSASGGDYGSVTGSVAVTVKDDDAPGLVVNPEKLEVREGGSGVFTVNLAARPSSAVTVSVASGDAGAATASPPSLTFTESDYGSARTVTVTGAPDADAENESTTVALSASGGGYEDVSASVEVRVKDDDARGLTVVPEALEIEEGGSATFEVNLATRPTDTVTVSVTSGDAGAATVEPASLSFTESDYGSARTVTVTGVVDAEEKDSSATVVLSASGGGYDDVSASVSVTVTNVETLSDGAAFVSYAGVPSAMVAGSSATVTVRMKNTGTTTWTPAGGYALGSQRPEDNATWGLSRVALASDVAPGGTVDFTFEITAPEDAGGHAFRWKMVRGGDGWFGQKTKLRRILVEEASSDDASFVSYVDVPSTMRAGASAAVTVTMKNTGTTTWTKAGGYALGSQRPEDNATWGPSRVALASDVAPGGTVDFTFGITAPEDAGGHAFRWKMVRGADGWFGRKTALREIAVTGPSFRDAAIPDRTWVKGEPIEALTLPEAVGGDGALTYALTPAPPDGVAFTEATRTLSGTPTALRAATEYTWTATDIDDDAVSLSFTIAVEESSVDDAELVSVSGVPSRMASGHAATVTVTMKNTGTTTWTSAGGYALGSWSAGGKDTWGSRRAPLSGSVSPSESVGFTFEITAPEATGSYGFSWRMVRDPGMWFGEATGEATILVEDPSFGDAAIPDQTWLQHEPVEALTLPAASGGDGALTYALTPAPPDGVSFDATTRILSGTPTTARAATAYAYTATDKDGDAATLAFTITVSRPSSTAESSAALGPGTGEEDAGASAPAGVFDMFEYWLAPHGSGMRIRARRGEVRLPVEAGAPVPALADDGGRVLGEAELAPAGGRPAVRSVWRGDLWGRKVALLGDPGGGRYDIFEEAGDGLDYWGTFEGGAAGDGGVQAGGDRLSRSLDRPFRWMNRHMAVGDVLESRVTGRLLSNRDRNQASVVETTMRLEVLSHRASFTIPVSDGPTFEDVLVVRFWPDAALPEVHDTFHLARGFGAVQRRSALAAREEVAEWWAVEKAPARVVLSGPAVPWFDPFSPGWPKTAVVNGNLEDLPGGIEGARVGSFAAPGWTADSADAVIARSPPGLAGGAWSLLLRGSDGGGDGAADAATTGEWIPVEGGTYRLSACMLRENAADNVVVDFADGKGRDADFADAHLVATSTGAWECRAVTKCVPASVGAVRIRAARDGANLGGA